MTTGKLNGAADPTRVVGLDGIRGLAALFVVVHHCWLMTFHGYPRNTGPFWLGWLLYGHFAVVVFITLSGFSLAISPARKGWQLGGKARFAQRRAWRILPPYWAALVFSLIIAWGLQVAQPASTLPNGKSVVVYGLLVQDIFGAPVPNGAFWSIAVEAQLYLVFPILLVILRRFGAAAVLAAVTVPVAAIGLLGPQLSIVDKLMRLTPQFAPLFAIGLLAAVATRRPAPLVWPLGTRPVRSLGTFSYSLYLVHAPIVVALARKFVGPHVPPGLPAFWVTLAIAVPLSVGFASLLATFFEIPFQRYR